MPSSSRASLHAAIESMSLSKHDAALTSNYSARTPASSSSSRRSTAPLHGRRPSTLARRLHQSHNRCHWLSSPDEWLFAADFLLVSYGDLVAFLLSEACLSRQNTADLPRLGFLLLRDTNGQDPGARNWLPPARRRRPRSCTARTRDLRLRRWKLPFSGAFTFPGKTWLSSGGRASRSGCSPAGFALPPSHKYGAILVGEHVDRGIDSATARNEKELSKTLATRWSDSNESKGSESKQCAFWGLHKGYKADRRVVKAAGKSRDQIFLRRRPR